MEVEILLVLLLLGTIIGFVVTAFALSNLKEETNRLKRQIDAMRQPNQPAWQGPPPVPAPFTAPPVSPPVPQEPAIAAAVPVKVTRKRIDVGPDSSIHIITFRTTRTADGVDRELAVPKDVYYSCNKGDTGTLTFENQACSGFERDAAAPQPVPAQPAAPSAPKPAAPPVLQPAPSPSANAQEKPRKPAMMESILGRHVLGIAASVLTFVGLILLGVLIYERITDTIKIIFMFLFSGTLAGLGVFLSLKNSNTFTRILTGCGFGSIFISIMLTHIYFGRISGMTAFALLLFWLAGALGLARRLKSTSISIVAHIGMAIAICFAYATTGAQSVPLLVYQMVSIAVIVVGNLLCSRKTYHFGLMISLALTITASGFIWPWSWPQGSGGAPAIMAALLAQFVCACILSWLLAGAADRLKNRTWAIILHVANKGLWIAALFMNVYWLVYRLAERGGPGSDEMKMKAYLAATTAGILVAVAHGCVTLFMARRQKIRKELEITSVLLMSGVIAVILFVWFNCFDQFYTIDYTQILPFIQYFRPLPIPQLTLLLLPAVLMMIARRFSRHKAYSIAALCYLGLDFLFMAEMGYSELNRIGNVALPLGYMMIYLGFIWGWGRSNKENMRHRTLARLLGYLVTMISLPVILLTSSLPLKGMILLLALTALNAVLGLLRFEGRGDGREKLPLYWVLRAGELLLLAANAICIAFVSILNAPGWLYLLLFGLSMVLALARVKEALPGKTARPCEELFTLAKITVLIMATVANFTRSSPNGWIILLLTITALSIAFHYTRKWLYKKQGIDLDYSYIDMIIRVSESLLLLANAIFIALVGARNAPWWMCLLLFGLSMTLALTRTKENLLGEKGRPGEEIFYMAKVTALILATVFHFAWRSPYCAMIMLLCGSALGIIYHFGCRLLYRRQGRSLANSPTDIVLWVFEALWFAADVSMIAFANKDSTSSALAYGLAVLAAALAFVRARKLFTARVKPWEEIFYGIKLTALAMAVVYGQTRWFDSAFVVSLVSMLTALACVVVGFKNQTKVLRLYGLILTLLCVLKLVTYDVAGLETVLRVVALIGGGIICFLISAIYSYSAKKIDAGAKLAHERRA